MKTLGSLCIAAMLPLLAQADPASLRKERDNLVERGLWKEALDHYREKLLPISDIGSGLDLQRAVQAIRQLNEWKEFDPLVEQAIALHPENHRILVAAAQSYHTVPHSGRLIAGEFERNPGIWWGGRRGGPDVGEGAAAGAQVATHYRDRTRAIQLILQAIAATTDDTEKADAWSNAAPILHTHEAWKLQTLTPLDTLPEWGEPGPSGGTEGAPWDGDAPVLYEVPATWDAATNDGQRWRFALAEQARLDPARAARMTLEYAHFTRAQLSEDTLASMAWWRQPDPDAAQGMLQLETLAENETLARTSDGVRRFTLPDSHHFIALYRSIFEQEPLAGDALVQIFLNRNQRDKAREALEQTIAKHGPGPNNSRKNLLAQITGNWGQFGTVAVVPKGTKPTLPLTFRNATRVTLTAAPVAMDAVVADTIAYLKSKPKELDWNRVNPGQIAGQLIQQDKSKYIGDVTATWHTPLTPPDLHRDGKTDIEAPLDAPGAYWITAKIDNGNEFQTLAWIVDSIILRRPIDGQEQWWIADAETGAPVEKANLEFFGYEVEHKRSPEPGKNRIEITTRQFTRTTDADGKTLLKPSDLNNRMQWLAIARHPDRAQSFFGFQHIHIPDSPDPLNTRDVSYGITDRPLYKPGDTVHLKFILRNLGYAAGDDARFANQAGTLTIYNGRGEEVIKMENLKTDTRGLAETSLIIPADAVLGQWRAHYHIESRISASVTFGVEEYRKPEYEVTVEAPAEPVTLGGSFTATIKANYFHGAPVRNADVHLTVKRSSISEPWFPNWRWDWLYGRGAWWLAPEAAWHPTWHIWGCIPPPPPWWSGNRHTPDEVVLQQTVAIGPDGTAEITIDTAAAKEIHGDLDARYTIEARVTDASRREESGTGTVIAARKPFEVVIWTNRGHAKSGDDIEATLRASTLAGKPVANVTGTLKLFRLALEGDRLAETEVQSWPLTTDAEGKATQRFAAPATGQYRLAATLTANNSPAVESATILNIHGDGRTDPEQWQFGALELIADQSEYAAGDTVRLRVNSDRTDAHTWLFLRITDRNTAREARRIQLDGKSLEVEIPLTLADMPNMFIEGITVHDGQIHTAVRQILLPPASKLIEVTLEPAKTRVKPQEKSSLRITLRDAEGKPVQGISTLTIYDKALEAITGGSNIGPINETFWGWKNHYYQTGSANSLPYPSGNLVRRGQSQMQFLGTFSRNLEHDHFFAKSERRGGMRMSTPAAPAMMLAEASADMAGFPEEAGGADGGGQNIAVRTDFADLLKWAGTIETDENGQAEIPIEFPDNLTTWKARVWSIGKGSTVGEGTTEIITSKELLVRLQAPRFLVERDVATFSAVVHNDHDTPKTVTVSLDLKGGIEAIDGAAQTLDIPARADARVDWRVKATKEGEATIRMTADAGDDGDAVERTIPIRVHGMSRQDAWSVVINPEDTSAKIDIAVPAERRPDQSTLTIRYSPTVAGAVIDAIPYLATYPHGCTEQTLNRFVPAVIAQNMLNELGVDLHEIRTKRTNLNPQQLGHPADRAAQWRKWHTNPVFDEAELKKIVATGVDRLTLMQNNDGGWGWFSGYGERSWPHTTAIVVHGLLTARANGAEIPAHVIDNGLAWLQAHENQQVAALQRHVEREAIRKENKNIKPDGLHEKIKADAIDAFIRMILGNASRDSEPMLAFLHRDRLELPVYAKCLLGLEHHRKKDTARRDEVMRVIAQFLKRDAENQTAFLELPHRNYWWFWYGSEIETHAWYLKLLTAVQPDHADTRGIAKYLVNNRRNATYWNSTRDTAYAVEALAGFFKASGESDPNLEVEVLINGESKRKVAITRDNLFTFDGTLVLSGEDVKTGEHTIELRKSGTGPLYANAYLEVFTLEDRFRPAGLEVKVARKVSKLVELAKDVEVPDATGLITTQTGQRFRRKPLADGAVLTSGDRIEVELILESKNDYEYLIFSDAKAAGFEALDALSGYIHGDGGFSTYMEPRNQTVDFFIRLLPRGTHTLRYQLRAEAPGIYKAMPAEASAMYAPELRGNSDDIKLVIE
ncbi:MAG: alpha-2-macroglobulin family protein [Luteolibacter sp.]